MNIKIANHPPVSMPPSEGSVGPKKTPPGQIASRFIGEVIQKLEATARGSVQSAADAGKPELSPPRMSGQADPSQALRNLQQAMQDDKELAGAFEDALDWLSRMEGQEAPPVAEALETSEKTDDNDFDVKGMATPMVALLVQAIRLMSLLASANAKMNSEWSKISFADAQNAAKSIIAEGSSSLAGSISQATLQFGITAFGSWKQHQGLKADRALLRDTAMPRRSEEMMKAFFSSNEGQKMLGKSIADLSNPVGSIASSGARTAATTEQANQQIMQAANRAATETAQSTNESKRAIDGLIQELLRILDAVNQSKTNAMGHIAGNIRA